MTADKPNPAQDFAAQHEELKQLLWDNIKQRLSGEAPPPDHLQAMIAALSNYQPDADLLAWEPESLNSDDTEEVTELSQRQRQILCETVAELPDGLSGADILAAMLKSCRAETPEQEERLRHFFADGIE